jgi:hypothetical protein
MIQPDLIPIVYMNQRIGKDEVRMFFMAPEFNDLPWEDRETVLDQLHGYLQGLRSQVGHEKRKKEV